MLMLRSLLLTMLCSLIPWGSASAALTNQFALGANDVSGDWGFNEWTNTSAPIKIRATPSYNSHTFSTRKANSHSFSTGTTFQPMGFTPDQTWVDVSLIFDGPALVGLNPVGQPLNYILGATNAGPATATGIVLSHPLPAGLTWLSAAPSQGSFSITNGILTWQVGNLLAGTAAHISLTGTPIVAQGETEITASVSVAQFDYNSQNNSGAVRMPLGVADLAVTIRRPPDDEIQAGVPFQLSVLVTNNGPDGSSATLFSDGQNDFIPVSYWLSQGAVVEFRDGGIPWQVEFGNVPPFGTARLTLTLIPKHSGEMVFISQVSGSTAHPTAAVAEFIVGEGQGIVAFTVTKMNVIENAGQALLAVSRNEGSSGTVQVSYATQDGTAIAGQDYVPTSGTLTFSPGETNKTILVPIINNAQPDCNRQLNVVLHDPAGGALLYGATNLALSIIDDDLIPSGELKALSVTTNGLNTGTGTFSAFPAISADGRWVVFTSTDGDLVTNDTNGVADVFLKDLHTGYLQLVSVNTNGNRSGNAASGAPAISADGRWVAFVTYATDIVTNFIPGGTAQAVVRDLVKGTTELVSVTSSGKGADGESGPSQGVNNYNGNPNGSISSDGRFVLFYHAGKDLVPGNTNSHVAYFVRDLVAHTNQLVNVNAAGTGAASGDQYPEAALSANGRRVVLRTRANDLVAGFNTGPYKVYVRDLPSGITIPVSVRYADGGPSQFDAGQAVISADGRYVAYSSGSGDLTTNDDNPNGDVFVRDVDAGTTVRASAGLSKTCGSPSLSADGRWVAFQCGESSGPVPPDNAQVYLFDCWSNTLSLVSVNCAGDGPCNRHARNPVISPDGRYVFFQSFASDLVPGLFGDSIVSQYRRDLMENKTVLVSANRNLTGGPSNPYGSFGIGFSYPALNTNGIVVAFASSAEDLVWGDGNGILDVFVWRSDHPSVNLPALQIKGDCSNVQVLWPRDATNFILQSASDLISPDWTDLLTTTTNSFFEVQPLSNVFYRLRQVDSH